MKHINLLLTIVLGFVMIFFNSCSSPESEGKKIGEKFCNCLGDFKTFTEPKQFNHVMDSCKNVIKDDWTKYENDYKKDEPKWDLFITSYEKARESKLNSFNDAQKLIYAEIEKKIKEQINDKLWLKKDENKGYYLYSFTDNALSIINCKGKTKFKLSVDTIKFEDTELTMAIVSFTEDGNLILTDCKSDKKGVYQIATKKDKLLGSWSVKGGFSVSFYQGGSCSVTQGWSTKNVRYSFRGNNLEIDGPPAYSVNLSTTDYFSFGQAQFYRNKYAHPKNLDMLFAKK